MWKTAEKVKIVYSVHDKIEYKGKKYPQAFIVTKDTQLNGAISWANWGGKKKPIIVETDNKDFTLTIGYAPEDSYNGGKRSFCNCIIEKDGIDTFVVGINSEYLFNELVETTVVNGVFQSKIIFAKNNNNLGAIIEGSTLYKELMKDEGTREKIATSKKTKNWIPGSVYSTLTMSDLYLGEYRDVVDLDCTSTITYGDTYKLTYSKEGPKKPFMETYRNERNYGELVFRGLSRTYNSDKVSARVFTKELIPFDANYKTTIENKMYDYLKKNFKDRWIRVTDIISTGFRFYDEDPEYTKKMLYLALDYLKSGVDLWYLDRVEYYHIYWEADHYQFKTCEEFINKLIEII